MMYRKGRLCYFFFVSAATEQFTPVLSHKAEQEEPYIALGGPKFLSPLCDQLAI